MKKSIFFLCPPALALFLGGCAGQEPVLFAGPLTPRAGACDPPATATLSLNGPVILFMPTSGTLVLNGRREGARFAATLSLPGQDRKPYLLAFTGLQENKIIRGAYVTPRCRYDVLLHATSD